ncbi:hypothetical protein OAO24_01140 [Methylophilaceae bacterium]|nr:hypothetical protein [Methylophilaceae bacterium]
MKKLFSLIIVSFLSVAFFNSALAGEDTCLKTGDAIITVSGNTATQVGTLADSTLDSCSDIPDEYKLEFHALSLCADDPRELDFSSCQYMLAPSDTTVSHIISYPASGALDIPKFSIVPGTYPYMMAILSNKLGIKDTITVTNAVTGAASSTGTTCWTSNAGPTGYTNEQYTSAHGATVAGGTQMLTCSNTASDAAPIFSYEIIAPLGEEDCLDGAAGWETFGARGGYGSVGDVGNGEGFGSLLQSNTAYATNCGNADRLLWTIVLDAPVTTTLTSSFDMRMRTVDAVSVDFSGESDNNDIVKMGADPIQAFLVVTN